MCEKLLNAVDLDEPIGKTDVFFAKRERASHPENPEYHTFGELCANTDEVTLKAMKPMQFEESGNVKGSFLVLDVHKAPLFNAQGELIGIVGSARDITKQKEIENELNKTKKIAEDNEARLLTFINSIPDIVCYKDGEGRWLLANDADLDLFCLKGVNYVGKTDAELADYTDEIYKKAFLTCIKSDEAAWKQKTISRNVEIIPTKSGDNKTYDVFKVPIFYPNGKRKGLAVVGRDISDLKEVQEKLVTSNSLYQSIFETTGTATFIVDENANVLVANNEATYLFGGDQKELLGKGWMRYMTKESLEKMIESHRKVREINNPDQRVSYEIQIVNKNKKIKSAILFGRLIPGTKQTVISVLDITDLKEIEKRLITAKEHAELSNKLKSEFLHNMSHEIRTPLNGIIGFTELLEENDLEKEEKEQYLSIIKHSGIQLLRIIEDILEISRLETKQVSVKEKKLNLNKLVTEHFLIFDINAKEKGISLYLKKGLSDEKSIIFSDEAKLNKIISNLLENAMKFTSTGYIELGYTLKNKLLDIYVKDTGIGIKPENQKIIFERFSQEEKELSKNVGGLGLGLSIVKENAELLGGKVYVQSEKGKGSTFHVSIPYRPLNRTFIHAESESITIKSNEKDNDYTILIVDDEEMNSFYIETLLKRQKEFTYNILQAHNGEEAIDICQKNSDIDIILMDLKMPQMNGFDACKKIKAIRPHLPIIAQTAYSTSEDKTKALKAGCNDFISKPILKKQFDKLIYKYLNVKL
jgi:PAS domain S-box-containing protein